MSKVIYKRQKIAFEGEPPYDVCDSLLVEDGLAKLLSSDPNDPLVISRTFESLTPEAKVRIKRACEKVGGSLLLVYATAAGKWAPVANISNEWELQNFQLVYQAEVPAAWASAVYITDMNIRLVRTPRGLRSFAEFNIEYGCNIRKYLEDWQTQQAQQVAEVCRHLSADLEHRKLVVNTNRGLVTRSFVGLASQDPSEWPSLNGFELVSPAD